MRKFFMLFTSFCCILLFSEIYAQEGILKDGFCIQTNPERKEVYLTDINEIKCRKSPRDVNNSSVSLHSIDVHFQKERNEMEKNIFKEEEIGQLRRYRIVATIYISNVSSG